MVGQWGIVIGTPGSLTLPANCVVALSLNSTKRVDHSNTRLVTQLDRNPGVYAAIQGL